MKQGRNRVVERIENEEGGMVKMVGGGNVNSYSEIGY